MASRLTSRVRAFKQSAKEKLGVATVTTKESVDFLTAKDNIKNLRKHLETISKILKQIQSLEAKHVEASKKFWGSVDTLANAVVTSSASTPGEGGNESETEDTSTSTATTTTFAVSSNVAGFSSALKALAQINRDVDANFQGHLKTLSSSSLAQISNFQKTDLNAFSNAKKRYYKARVDYDSARSHRGSLQKKTSGIDPKKIQSAQKQENECKLVWKDMRTNIFVHVMDIGARKDYYLLSSIISMARSSQSFYSQSYARLYTSKHFLMALSDYVQTQRKLFLTTIKTRSDQSKEIAEYRKQHKNAQFIHSLLSPDLSLLTAMLSAVAKQKDAILENLIKLFDAAGVLPDMLRAAIEFEVAETNQSSTLFRGNSVSTKLMSTFTQLFGKQYLIDTLQELIQEVIDNDVPYEVDPKKLPEGENAEVNIKNLQDLTLRFLNRIINSKKNCPPVFRIVGYHLRTIVHAKFPELDETIGVGGFLFLRFFCPAMFSPLKYDIVSKPPPKNKQRALILVTKILQNLANGVTFSVKNAHLYPLNEFIENKMPISRKYFTEMSTVDDLKYIKWTPLETAEHAENVLVPWFANLIKMNLLPIQKSLTDYKFGHRYPMIIASVVQSSGPELPETEENSAKA